MWLRNSPLFGNWFLLDIGVYTCQLWVYTCDIMWLNWFNSGDCWSLCTSWWWFRQWFPDPITGCSSALLCVWFPGKAATWTGDHGHPTCSGLGSSGVRGCNQKKGCKVDDTQAGWDLQGTGGTSESMELWRTRQVDPRVCRLRDGQGKIGPNSQQKSSGFKTSENDGLKPLDLCWALCVELSGCMFSPWYSLSSSYSTLSVIRVFLSYIHEKHEYIVYSIYYIISYIYICCLLYISIILHEKNDAHTTDAAHLSVASVLVDVILAGDFRQTKPQAHPREGGWEGDVGWWVLCVGGTPSWRTQA